MSFKNFYLTEKNSQKLAKPSKEYPIPEQLKPFYNKLGKIDFTELQKGNPIYLQWMAGTTQERGNTSFFYELNEETYDRFIEDSALDLAPPFIAQAPSYEELEKFIRSKIGDKPFYYSSYFLHEDRIFVADEFYGVNVEDLRPNNPENLEKGNFFIQVDKPNSKEAQVFGSIKDDDVYVYTRQTGNNEAGAPIASVRFRNEKTDGKFEG